VNRRVNDALQGLVEGLHSNALSLVGLKAELQTLKDNVSMISNLINVDQGRGTLVTRIHVMERVCETIQNDLRAVKSADMATKKEDLRGRWQLRLALISAAVSLIATLATIISHIK
jgi:hypothetical protein